MIIHFLREDALGTLKANIAENVKKYNLASNDWIYDACDNPFGEFKLPIGELQFVTTLEAGSIGKADVENAIRLYTAMMDLSDTQATDERLWAGLSHGDFYSYMYARWQDGQSSGKSMTASILERYFITDTRSKRGLFTNTIARLWWVGRLTYDKANTDNFHLTRYFENDFSTKVRMLFSNNYMANHEIAKGLLEALIELEASELSAGVTRRNIYSQAGQYLNIYGGIHILDYYTAEEIKEKVLAYMYPWLEENAARLMRLE